MAGISDGGGRVKRRAYGFAAGLVAAACLAMPASALAGQDDIYTGVVPHGGVYGPRHSLTSTWVTWYSIADACVTAYDPSAGFYQGVCANGSNTNVGRSFCGCELRYGYAYGANDAYSDGYWRQFW